MKKRIKYFSLGLVAAFVTYTNFSFFLLEINPVYWDDKSIGFFIVLACLEIFIGGVASLFLGGDK